ncbi:MAG: Thymidylate synthase [Alphaproteobacteria bacterium MarineAlpha5_Bin5]|nr:MAG: Thymidylate synthase [Alphaproteobacteria bacterium MarineAlpha5_Bin5]PPR52045.1 MAG: Thymidylate synthase [Alphaproteobacteria bacterium MarineAlpha5_Bin4]|tara:strand:+ start:1631 stop:2461 length:831 start_codon:yes stop_codon:yes gene_type:complete
MKQYLEALKNCYEKGIDVESRAGKVRKSFGYQMKFDLNKGFPAVTTKKLAWKAVVSELLWFLEGSNDERRLAEILYNDKKENLIDKKTIWTQNAEADYWKTKAKFKGDVGKIYGVQWRNFNGVDQIKTLIESLKKNPNSRRHILTAWNPSELHLMSLPPCHAFSQFFISNNQLSCQLYQRSCDMFLGVPFNIASYSLLIHIIARECDLNVGEFVHTLGDYHIYHEHFQQVEIQLSRLPKKLPEIEFATNQLNKYKIDDFKLKNYDPHPAITAEMNV